MSHQHESTTVPSPDLDRKTARAVALMIARDRDAFHYPAGAGPAISRVVKRDEDLGQIVAMLDNTSKPVQAVEQLIDRAREQNAASACHDEQLTPQVSETLRMALNYLDEHYFNETDRDWTAGELQARLEAATSALAMRAAV
jgi:hypothetical protein